MGQDAAVIDYQLRQGLADREIPVDLVVPEVQALQGGVAFQGAAEALQHQRRLVPVPSDGIVAERERTELRGDTGHLQSLSQMAQPNAAELVPAQVQILDRVQLPVVQKL